MSSESTGGAHEVVSTRVLTIPNLVSFARLGMLPVFLIIYIAGHFLAATILLIVVGTTDFLDGYLARRLHQVSELGKLLDPVADRLVIISALVAFGVKHVVAWPLVAFIIARDAVVIVAFAILEKRGMPRLPVNRTGKRATASLFVGFGFTAGGVLLRASGVPFMRAHAYVLRDIGLTGLVLGAVLYWAAGWLYAVEIRRYFAAQAAGPGTR